MADPGNLVDSGASGHMVGVEYVTREEFRTGRIGSSFAESNC